MTPQTEEIYANKWITLLARATFRDLYDAHIIAETDTDTAKLRKCAVLESLMSLPHPLTAAPSLVPLSSPRRTRTEAARMTNEGIGARVSLRLKAMA